MSKCCRSSKSTVRHGVVWFSAPNAREMCSSVCVGVSLTPTTIACVGARACLCGCEPVCVSCKSHNDDYDLITKGEVQSRYLLPEGSIAMLKFLEKENPRHGSWTTMKLYLNKQVWCGVLRCDRDSRDNFGASAPICTHPHTPVLCRCGIICLLGSKQGH